VAREKARSVSATWACRRPEDTAETCDTLDPRVESLFLRFHRDGDCSARDEITECFVPLARKLARRYARSSEPYEDLVQVASLALVKAIDRFEPGRGSRFEAFAIPTIVGELRRYFRDCTWAIHVSRGAQERARAIDEATTLLSEQHGRAPTLGELGEYLELAREDVLDGLQVALAYTAASLDEPCHSGEDDECTVGAAIGTVDERYELIEADIAVTKAVRTLSDRERLVLHLRFVKELTQLQIAAEIGVSQVHVSRILREALTRLRMLAE
jgi:RNA polymerase sigma-B factor